MGWMKVAFVAALNDLECELGEPAPYDDRFGCVVCDRHALNYMCCEREDCLLADVRRTIDGDEDA